jgi:UPF0755 protein
MKSVKSILWIVLAVGLSILAFFIVWYSAGLRPVDPADQVKQTFKLEAGSGTNGTAAALKSQNLIRNASVFETYITINGLRGKIQAGTYNIAPSMSVSDIADVITKGAVASDKIVIPEGYNMDQITALAVKKGYDKAEFQQALNADYTNDFLAARPAGASLEGYLFPGSYTTTADYNSKALIQAMLDNFGKQVTPDLQAAYQAEGLTLEQAVTLASIVEKETSSAADQPGVAQVFFLRIKTGMALGSDPTVIYAAEQLGKPFDVKLDSPYNTYLHKGLPPGPICNPGLSALKAVAHPAAGDYLYFIADKSGVTHYAKTFAEHQANINTYLK